MRLRRVELLAQEDRAHHLADRMARRDVRLLQGVDHVGRGRVPGEERPELCAEKAAGHRARGVRPVDEDADRVVPVPVAGLPEDRLAAAVVVGGAVQEGRLVVVGGAVVVGHRPPGEGPRELGDVLLRVVPDPEREELHELARVVLVGPADLVGRVVEPDQHRGVLRHLEHQVVELAGRVLPLRLVLRQHQPLALDLRDAGGPVEVPEVSQLFLQRPRREGHAVHEPLLEAGHARQVVVAGGQGRLVRGEVDRVVVEQERDRALEAPGVERVDLRGRPAESRSSKQVRRRVPGPVHAHGGLDEAPIGRFTSPDSKCRSARLRYHRAGLMKYRLLLAAAALLALARAASSQTTTTQPEGVLFPTQDSGRVNGVRLQVAARRLGLVPRGDLRQHRLPQGRRHQALADPDERADRRQPGGLPDRRQPGLVHRERPEPDRRRQLRLRPPGHHDRPAHRVGHSRHDPGRVLPGPGRPRLAPAERRRHAVLQSGHAGGHQLAVDGHLRVCGHDRRPGRILLARGLRQQPDRPLVSGRADGDLLELLPARREAA